MKYIVTRKYLRTNEQAVASFYSSEDADLFVREKIVLDERNKKQVLYRVYDDVQLIQEITNEIHSSIEAEDPESFTNTQFAFNVRIQRDKCIAYFYDKDDAQLFIRFKCLDTTDSQETYLMFKEELLMATINKNIVENERMREKIEVGGKGQRFNPSPIKMTNKPAGGPPDCWDDKEEEK